MIWSLQNYSTYSLKSGTMEPKRWVNRAAELGYETLALTDKQTLAGLLEFQKECDKNDIHSVLGTEFLVSPNVETRNKAMKENIRGVVLLYAKNDEGLKNLIALNNFSNDKSRGFYYRPRVDLEVIEEHSEGLLCVVPTEDGWGRDVEPNSTKLDVPKRLYDIFNIFGDDFYLGMNPAAEDEVKEVKLRNAAVSGLDMKKVYTFNAHYPEARQSHLYDIVRRMDGDGRMTKNLPRTVVNGYLPSRDEIVYDEELDAECMSHLDEIAEKCQARIQTGTYYMPEMETETGSVKGDLLKYIGEGVLKKLCPDIAFEGEYLQSLDELEAYRDAFSHIYAFEHASKGEVEYEKTVPYLTAVAEPREIFEHNLHTLDVYLDRLKYEFEIIEQLGYLDYFQIIRYLCAYIDEQGLGRGFARGSAAGSLVSYLLDITKVDPLRHGLIFERFLNPDRNDLPDIDLDFSAEARDEIKHHIKDKWGEEYVCDIGAYGRLKIVSAIKKVAASNGYAIPDNNGKHVQYSFGRLTALLSNTHAKATARGRAELEERLEGSAEFQDFVAMHSDWIEDVIMPLQEMVTFTQVHACGSLITRFPLNECVPLYEHKSGAMVSQWKYQDCEAAGHPKFDFLTVEGVSVSEFAGQLIKKRKGVDIPPIEDVPLDDPKALELFTQVKTQGIFQFNTWSQRNYFQDLMPDRFDELVAAVALVRPGPIAADAHTDFARIKHGSKEPEYDHPDLKKVLGETHGLLVYQEQMMEIAREIAGFSGSQADYLRKACGKKKLKAMRKWKEVFIEGGKENGYEQELMETLWVKIVAFAEYSFNKSHAVAYTLLSYYQAYIKARHNVEFWPAVLKYSDSSKDAGSPQDLKHLVKQYGIEIVYPTIYGYAPDFEPAEGEDQIYWPLRAINGIGDSVIGELCKDGRRGFTSIEEMMEECDLRKVHKGVMGKLIKAGFFDPIAPPWEVAEIYFKIRKDNGRKDGGIPYYLSHRNKFRWYQERNDAYGMIVKPWKEVAPFHPKVQSYPESRLSRVKKDQAMFVGGYVEDMRVEKTKNGGWYARMTLVDEGEEHTVMMWPGFFESRDLDRPDENGVIHRPWKGQLVELTGKKDEWNGRVQVVLNSPRSYCRVIWDEMDLEEYQ